MSSLKTLVGIVSVSVAKLQSICIASHRNCFRCFMPQIWLLVGPMLIMLVLPRLMKNMDPDSQKVGCLYEFQYLRIALNFAC